jgi:NAD(P)-dependent dehydrogenase (short-subunit alcohol dehydrogenase family)
VAGAADIPARHTELTTGRLAEPQEIADTVALLVSPHAASTTGTEVVVDSGMMKT